jgi:uncharacterized protein YuzE
MKLTYHPKYNVAYIAMKDKAEQVETISLSEDVKVDLAPDGTIYGIESFNMRQRGKQRRVCPPSSQIQQGVR